MMRLSTETRTQVGFTIAIIALIGMSLIAFRTIRDDQRSTQLLASAHQRLLAIGDLRADFDAVLTAQNQFLLLDDKSQRQVHADALQILKASRDALLSTTAPATQLSASYHELYNLITQTIALLDVASDNAFSTSPQSSTQTLRTSAAYRQAFSASPQIHQLIDRIVAAEKEQIDSVAHIAEKNDAALFQIQAIASLLAFVTLLSLAIYIRIDLRQRRHTENQLLDAKIYFESLIENMPTMIFIKDAKTLRFVQINKAGETLLGITRQELIGKSDHDFFPADQAEFFIRKDREVLAQDKVLEIQEEAINTRVHGQRWLHTLKVPLLNAQGQPVFLLGISMDITQQIAAERNIKALNAELEQNARLLKLSNSELETFTYSVSHDLRAPLRTIEGFAQLLEDNQQNSMNADSLRYLDIIRRSSKQMSQLIDDLLAYSKVGRQAVVLQRLDMKKLVTKVIEIAAFGRNPNPDIVIDSLPEAFGDETMLSSVWLNLIDNAIKYSAKNAAPKIHISAHRDRHMTVYSVQDNGAGFDMQHYGKLFDVFQRLHSDRDFSGTGLGLAIVERIVSRHGGKVWAESKPNQGAIFYFSLPIGVETVTC